MEITLPRKKDISYLTLSEPPKEMLDQQEEADEVEDRFRRQAIELDPDFKQDLEAKLWYQIWDWKNSRASLQAKLRELNDLYEGVVRVTDFPWVGASQLHVPIPKIKAREIKSTINRNTMRPIPFLMTKYAGPDSGYENSKEFIRDIQDFIEDKIKSTNVHQTLKDALIPIIRDGTTVPQIVWETELERCMDRKRYQSVRDFLSDYPDAKSAGINEDRFAKIIRNLSQGNPYEVAYEYDEKIYDGPRAYLVGLIDFFNWPVFETEIAHMLTHGKRIWYKDYDVERFFQMGKFTNQEDVELILKGVGDIHEDETLTISRDVIEGINRTNITKTRAREYEFYELVHRMDVDGDGVKEKYLLYYHWKTRRIMRVERYPIRKGATTYFPLRIVKRDNRFLGMSLIEDIADLSLEIDILHRMRINSRTITHVPSFKAVAGAKDRFDPSRPQYRFQPGVTFWLNDIKDVEQFDIKPVDLSGSVEEENMLFQIVNLVTGSDSGQSGQSNPIDPRAPAHKQAELLRQSSNRIDDYVEALLEPFAQIGKFMLDLYYQYGEYQLKYYVRQQDGSYLQKEIERSKLFNPNVLFQVNGTSVFMNPDAEFSRMQEIAQMLNEFPITARDSGVQLEMLTRLLDSSRIKNPMALLPSQGQVQAITNETAPGSTLIPSDEMIKQKGKMDVTRHRMGMRQLEQQQKHKHEIEMQMIKNAQEHGGNALDQQHQLLMAHVAGVIEQANQASATTPSTPENPTAQPQQQAA
jgi:hypothetical protein